MPYIEVSTVSSGPQSIEVNHITAINVASTVAAPALAVIFTSDGRLQRVLEDQATVLDLITAALQQATGPFATWYYEDDALLLTIHGTKVQVPITLSQAGKGGMFTDAGGIITAGQDYMGSLLADLRFEVTTANFFALLEFGLELRPDALAPWVPMPALSFVQGSTTEAHWTALQPLVGISAGEQIRMVATLLVGSQANATATVDSHLAIRLEG